MATYVPPKINTEYIFYVSLVSQANTKLFQANPTLAAGDVKVATDDAAPANLTTLPVVDADFTKRVKVTVSAAEMNGGNVSLIFSDAAGAEWCDLKVNLQTAARQIDDIPTAAQINTEVVDALNVDTYAEPGQEAPPATTTLQKKISYCFKLLRNKLTQTSTELKVFADDTTTVDQKATVSDDGTTYTRGELGTGP